MSTILDSREPMTEKLAETGQRIGIAGLIAWLSFWASAGLALGTYALLHPSFNALVATILFVCICSLTMARLVSHYVKRTGPWTVVQCTIMGVHTFIMLAVAFKLGH